jgi:hypothetical protein
VRHRVEAVGSALRADRNRLEQDVVAAIPGHYRSLALLNDCSIGQRRPAGNRQ